MQKNIIKILDALQSTDNEAIKMSLDNVHAKGLFSLVISGAEPGKLSRIFIANKKVKPLTVQYHDHRYDLTITPIKGTITHHVAEIYGKVTDQSPQGLVKVVQMNKYKYHSFLNGGKGLSEEGSVAVKLSDYTMAQGSQMYLSEHDIHTVSCSKGAMWLVEEHGFKKETSTVLGQPFTINGLYNEPPMFKVNDMCQAVLKECTRIMNDYNSLD
jgi:hypothetical protein